MTKYELAKLFSDVDDKYIEGARPMAQRAVMLKTARHYPMRIIAAASCAAVLAGGVITVTAVHNRNISALHNSNTASITNSSFADESALTNTTNDPNVDDVSSNESSAQVEGKMLTPEEWAQKPLVLPSKFAPEDLDFVNTGIGYNGQNTPIPADKGSEVYAVDGGEVVFAKYDSAYNAGCGSFVFIKHGEGLYTLYAGLLPVKEGGKAYVSAGDNVMAGTVIGLAGNSGLQREYGVSYGFYTELPECFKFIKGLVNTDSSSGGEESDLPAQDAPEDGFIEWDWETYWSKH